MTTPSTPAATTASRLYIDGEPVIDYWEPDWDNEQTSVPIRLAAGEKHDFRLEMFQDTGGANMFLRWSAPDLPKQVVPMSAFTPPAGFEVYPVEPSVSENGRQVRARFEGRVGGDVKALVDHLEIEADTTPMPIDSVTVTPGDRDALLITLAEPIQKNQQVRVVYDGEGGLTSGGETVPKILRYAQNDSTHRLTTKWGDKLDTKNPLPEYPRPQQVRDKWKNLNGPWQFAGADAGEQPVFGKDLNEKIVVPFPVESQLSGLERHEDHMFYRKLVDVPKSWKVGKGNKGHRLKLNFGAVDYQARVWVNGERSPNTPVATPPSAPTSPTRSRARDRRRSWSPSPTPAAPTSRWASRPPTRAASSTPSRRASGRRCGWSRSPTPPLTT